jgi:murein DD-endopeptidase MepM/ murein hydrolase activator NlpD
MPAAGASAAHATPSPCAASSAPLTKGGRFVLQHDDTYETVYAHLSALEVQEGETVRSGDLIGRVGNTGLSKGPHLHYEVHVKGDAVNPEDFLPAGR